MKRKFVYSEAEFVHVLVKECRRNRICVGDMEALLGLEFPYKDGTFLSDEDKLPEGTNYSQWESQQCDFTKYRKTEPKLFPKSYPVALLYQLENEFDRMGSFDIRLIEFVELAEFSLARNRPRVPLPGA
jgi:hypothetical protein